MATVKVFMVDGGAAVGVDPTTARIAKLNDMARKAMGVCSQLRQTEGINALPPSDQSRIREKVENFNAFTPDNDPHGERDFGSFEQEIGKNTGCTVKVFWKIDYFDKNLEYGSDHPEDPAATVRVLTIMLAEEY